MIEAIKRFLNLTEEIEKQEEEKFVMGRRTFFFMSAGALLIPKVTGTFEYLEAKDLTDVVIADQPIFLDYLAPGAIEIARYQAEIFEQVKRQFGLTKNNFGERTYEQFKTSSSNYGRVVRRRVTHNQKSGFKRRS